MPDREVRMEIALARQTPAIGMEITAGTGTGTGAGGVAERLAVPRRIALAGDALGDALFDGSQDVAIYTAVEKLTNLELEELLQ